MPPGPSFAFHCAIDTSSKLLIPRAHLALANTRITVLARRTRSGAFYWFNAHENYFEEQKDEQPSLENEQNNQRLPVKRLIMLRVEGIPIPQTPSMLGLLASKQSPLAIRYTRDAGKHNSPTATYFWGPIAGRRFSAILTPVPVPGSFQCACRDPEVKYDSKHLISRNYCTNLVSRRALQTVATACLRKCVLQPDTFERWTETLVVLNSFQFACWESQTSNLRV